MKLREMIAELQKIQEMVGEENPEMVVNSGPDGLSDGIYDVKECEYCDFGKAVEIWVKP